MKYLFASFAALGLVALLFSSCKEDPQEILVKSVTLSEQTLDLTVGGSHVLTVTVEPSNAADKTITWTSSDATVASCDNEGNIEALKVGETVITATAVTGSKDRCVVRVSDGIVHVSGVRFREQSKELIKGESFTPEYDILPQGAANTNVTWASSNTGVATVSNTGEVKAVESGSALITVTTAEGGFKDKLLVTVRSTKMAASTIPASSISCRAAKLGGSVIPPVGIGASLVKKGIIYSTDPNPQPENSVWLPVPEASLSNNDFTVYAKVLEPGTTYYYRAYGILDEEAIVLSDVARFNTLDLSSMLGVLPASDINPQSATLNATLDLTDCFAGSISYGFVLYMPGGASRTYQVGNNPDNIHDNQFSLSVGNLDINAVHAYKAYVTIDGRTYETILINFQTAAVQASVTLNQETVAPKSATLGGNVTVTSPGTYTKSVELFYSKDVSTAAELVATGTRNVPTIQAGGSFTTLVDPLSQNTTYHYVVVASVSGFDFYSEVRSFQTTQYDLQVTTSEATAITYTTAKLAGSFVLSNTTDKPGRTAGFYFSSTASTQEALAATSFISVATYYSNTSYTKDITGLEPGTTYYFMAAVSIEDVNYYGTVLNFTTPESVPSNEVDLGLTVKWANANVGATAPEGEGDYFCWGEPAPRTPPFGGYKYDLGTSATSMKKYNATDGLTTLVADDDAVAVLVGNGWRMPTKDEAQELIDNCTQEWTQLNGVYGLKMTSNKPNYTNVSIFFPATGHYYANASGTVSTLSGVGNFVRIWTSSLVASGSYNNAYYFGTNQDLAYYGVRTDFRFNGKQLRGVKPKN